MASPSLLANSDALVQAWTEINSSLDPIDVYAKACRAAVNLLGVDHSTFVRFDERVVTGLVVAEHYRDSLPEEFARTAAIDMPIPLFGIPEEQSLIQRKVTHLQFDDVDLLDPGVFKTNLRRLGVKSVAIFPVVSRTGKMFGSFSLDSIAAPRCFEEADRRLSEALAAAIAQALDNARTFSAERHRSTLLTKLEEERQHLKSASNEAEFQNSMVESARAMSNWSIAVLYRVTEDLSQLNLVARSSEQFLHLTVPISDRTWLGRYALAGGGYSLVSDEESAELFKNEPFLEGFHRALAIALTPYSHLELILVMMDAETDREFADVDAEYLRMLAARATIEIEKQVWWEGVWEKLTLQFLPLIGPGPSNEAEFEKLLYDFLTMVTANFGLKFNRAVLFLRQESTDKVESRMGLGHFKLEDWEADCALVRSTQMDRFETWFQWARTVTDRKYTPLESWARERHAFPLKDAFEDVLLERDSPIVLREPSEFQRLPDELRGLLNSTQPVAVAPLRDGLDVIGVLVADREFSHQYVGDRDLLLLGILCRQVALAIGSYLRFRRIPALTALFERVGSIKLQPGFDSWTEDKVLREVVEAASKGFEAPAVAQLLADQHGKSGSPQFSDSATKACGNAVLSIDFIPTEVINGGIAAIVEGTKISRNVELTRHGISAVIFLPIVTEGQTRGVVALYYRKSLGFRGPDVGTLQRVANEASLVYETWVVLHDRAEMHRATTEILGDLPSGNTSHRMVAAAQRIFAAKLATFWPYDVRKQAFVVEKCESAPTGQRGPAPERGSTTYRILREGYEDVSDVDGIQVQLSTRTVAYLREKNLRSLQGIALQTGEEALGVLYVMFGETRIFHSGARRRLQDFARLASMVLKAALVVENQREAYQSAQKVSRVLAVGNIQNTLAEIAARSRKELRSDIMTLFECDEKTYRPDFPPVAMDGEFNRKRMEDEDRPDAERLVPELINKAEITVACNAAEMKKEFDSLFARHEGILAAAAIPLEFSNRRVGLMFASFRNELPTTEVEPVRALARLFADQAAVAIGNMKRFRALAQLAAAIVAEDERSKIFDTTVRFVQEQFQTEFCAIVLKEGEQLFVAAHDGWKGHLPECLEPDSHAGFTIRTGRANWFDALDGVAMDRRFDGFIPPQRMRDLGIVSGLAVPVNGQLRALGGILVHTRSRRTFTGEDAAFLSLVAGQFIIAQRSARRNQRTRAQYEAAEGVVDTGGESIHKAFNHILEVGLKYLKDEVGHAKVTGGRLELTDDELQEGEHSPSSEAGVPDWSNRRIRMELKDGSKTIGGIWFSGSGIRELDPEDQELVKDLANLAVIVAREWKERRRHLRNLGLMTHEMRRSLQTAHMSAQRMMRDELTEKQLNLMTYIHADLVEMETLRQNVEYIVKVLSGQLKPEFSRVRVSELAKTLQATAFQITSKAKTRGIEIASELGLVLSDNKNYLYLDLRLIDALFRNIVDNAVKFSEDGGHVACRFVIENDSFRIEVEDNGPGISNSEQHLIYRLWHRAAEHGTYSRDGLGAGLAICQIVKELHAGCEITLRTSTTDPTGSTFIVTLPLGSLKLA